MTDTELVDAMADLRIVDAIGKIDINEATLNVLSKTNINSNDETQWKLEWRKQFRLAVAAWVKQSRRSQHASH